MDSNIPSCHDQTGLNSDSNNAISLLIFCVFIKTYLNFLFLAPYIEEKPVPRSLASSDLD